MVSLNLTQILLRVFCAVAVCVGLTAHVSAQQSRRPQRRTVTTPARRPAPPTPPKELTGPRPGEDPDVESADLSITATVKAQSLRFDVVGNPTVEFPGKPDRTTQWEAERENLPSPLQPGVTYRDIGIRLKITSVFADIDRIVAEALGEVPPAADAPPAAKPTDGKVPVPSKPVSNPPPPPPPQRERP